MRVLRILLPLASLALGSCAIIASAQSLDARINATAAARVQFEFAARPGVCGDGQSFLSTGNGSSFYGRVSLGSDVAMQTCSAGPVRVVIQRADRLVIGIQTVAGPLHQADAATDLGTVTAREATDYLLSIAAHADGRVSRDAILPASLADGSDIAPGLTSIVVDQTRPLETRRTALSSLADNDASGRAARTGELLLRVARDENETQPMRRYALNLLARFDHGADVPAIVQLASENRTSWIGDESLRTLSQSGDPRAREFLRSELRRTDVPDAQVATVVRGLGGAEASGRDIELLRAAFSTMTGDRARGTVMDVMSERGSAADIGWLVGIARDSAQSLQTRRHAISLLSRTQDARARQALLELTTR
ncbi:MAG: hypothetical protein M3R65_03250 [Gemmatimonadota bacterium]|nr:hypothetical protein [Gemmatimonadota bacterium]